LNIDIDNAIKNEQTARWKHTLDNITFRTNPGRLWKLVRGLSNRYSDIVDTHESLNTNKRDISDTVQANILNNHYARISHLPHRQQDREIIHRLHCTHMEELDPPLFSERMTVEAIKRAKNSTSTGPDGISYLHLKNLGPHAIRALTSIFNKSIQHNTIPNTWKLSRIIPILKPNKPPTDPASYRPISLISNPAKILERLVLDNITPHIPLADSQHGFRPKHSTYTLLTNITQKTLEGLNDRKPARRTIVAAIDISKAFDTVPRHLLIDKILNTHIQSNVKKWLANYLSGRQGRTEYNGKSSRTKHYTNGVPQGSVLSPTLFNLYMHDIPVPTHPNVHALSYADDLTVISQSPSYGAATAQLQEYMSCLELWLNRNRLRVSASKSSVTLITPYTAEYSAEPQVLLNGSAIPVTTDAKILGVTYDRGMTFSSHVSNIVQKTHSRLNVLRALTHTTYGQAKEDIIALYRQFIRPVLTYSSSAWAPDTARTHVEKLQRVQNSALRIATGCTRSTPLAHLHSEAKVLPIAEHMDMRGTQLFAATRSESHPLREALERRHTPRRIHKTPADHYGAQYDELPPAPRNTTLRTHIHSTHTARALENLAPNSILGAPPPLIAGEESNLSRQDRVSLARIRCGHHPGLDSYKHRIGRAVADTCTRCLSGRGDAQHVLLHCVETQTQRAQHNIQSLEHLWTHPRNAAAFLRDVGLT
jgi:hypothetical protein